MRTVWKFSERPASLADMIDVKKYAAGDWEALCRLLQRRADPPATEVEVLELSGETLMTVIQSMVDAVSRGTHAIKMPKADLTVQ